MTEQHSKRRIAAMLGAAVIGMTALLGTGAAANAAPQSYGDIDHARTGSLTVHKYLHQKTPVTADISVAPNAGDFVGPVQDVFFTAYPILQGDSMIDLSVAANWDSLVTLAPGINCAAPTGYTLGTAVPFPATDASGMAKIDLEVGAYQVCETSSPSNIIDSAAPFVVTIPMPHEGGWVYDVHAYPKNAEAHIEKTIEAQEGLGLGAVVKFPVTVPIPTTGDDWTGFAIRDTLDARLTPVSPANTSVTVDGVTLDSDLYEIEVSGQRVTMNFTPDGLAWLNEGPNEQAGKTVQVIFAGTVTSVGDGTIENQAELWPNNPGFNPSVTPPIPSNVVKSNWGSLEVQKRAANTTGITGTLNGAVFEVYNASDPYAADCSTVEAAGTPVVVDGKTQFTSAGTGVIAVAGLFVSDNVNPVIDAQVRCYVLKEVEAPAGYTLPVNQFTPVAVKIGETAVSDNVEIVNTQQDVPELPLTGAAGQTLLIAGGVGALAIAGGLVLLSRRRQASNDKSVQV